MASMIGGSCHGESSEYLQKLRGLHASPPVGKEHVLESCGHLIDFRSGCMEVQSNQNPEFTKSSYNSHCECELNE